MYSTFFLSLSILYTLMSYFYYPVYSFVDLNNSYLKKKYVTYRIDKRNKMLNALVGSSWGQEKATL